MRLGGTVLCGAIMAGLSINAIAAVQTIPGSLDSSFSNDGILSQSVYFNSLNITEHANAIIVDGNQKLVVLGSNNQEFSGNWGSAFIARFNADGQLDDSFASGGVMQFPYGYMLSDAKIDSNGHIVISGYEFSQTEDECWETQTLLIRLTEQGQYDTGFGGSGMAKFDKTDCSYFFSETTAGHSLVLDNEDNIITNSLVNVGEDYESVIVKYAGVGVVDISFGVEGVAKTDWTHSLWDNYNIRLALDSQQNLYVGASEDADFGDKGKLRVIKYRTSGTLDTDFSSSGKLTIEGHDYDTNLDELLITNNDNLLLLQHEGYAEESIYVYAINDLGQTNTDYGNSGMVQLNIPATAGDNLSVTEASAVLDSDDNLVIAYYSEYLGRSIDKVVVSRYDNKGDLDSDFGNSGTAVFAKDNHISGGRRLTLNNAGQVLVAGFATDSDDVTDLLIIKSKADGSIDTTFADNGMSVTSVTEQLISGSEDILNATVFLDNGQILGVGSSTRMVDGASQSQLLVTKASSQGAFDSSFGDNGKLLLDLTHAPQSVKAALDDSGRTVVVASGDKSVTTLRLQADGTLDTSFGSDGYFVTSYNHDVGVEAMALLSDGTSYQIVSVVEQYRQTGENNIVAGLLSVTEAGQLDSAFAGGGQLALSSMEVFGLFEGDNNTFSVIGTDYSNIITEHFALNGSDSTQYNSTGKALVTPSEHVALQDMVDWHLEAAALDVNDNIWVVINGQDSLGGGSNMLFRFNRAGLMDSRFVKSFSFNDATLATEHVQDLTVDLLGNLLVTHHNGISEFDFDEFYGSNITRLTSIGEVDVDFGTEGKTRTLDTESFETLIDRQGNLFMAGIRPDGEELLSAGSYFELANYAWVKVHNGSPGLYAPQSLISWRNEGEVKAVSSAELELTGDNEKITIAKVVSSGTLFNDINGNGELNGGTELLTAGESITKSEVDAGRLKFIAIDAQSAYFEFLVDDEQTAQTLLLPVNPKPAPTLYAPTQSPSTGVLPVVEIDFGELVTGFESSDIQVGNGSVKQLSFDGYSYQLTVEPSDNLSDGDKISVSVPVDAAQDLANATSYGISTEFSWVNYLPVEISTPSASQTSVGPVTIDVTFSGVQNSFELSADEVVLQTEGDVAATVTIANGGTLTPKITVDNISGNGSFNVLIAQGAGEASGGMKTQARQSDTVKVINVAPTLNITLDTASRTVHGPSIFTVNFENAETVDLTSDKVTVISDDGVTAKVTVIDGTSTKPQVELSDFRGVGFVGISIPAGVAMSASNLPSEAVSAPFSIRLLENNPPTIAGSPSDSVIEGDAYLFQVVASDVDGSDGLEFAITNKPGWATFNKVTGIFSGTPGATDVATYQGINISVTDPRGDSGSLPEFSIEVVSKDGGGGDGGGDGGGTDGGTGGGTDGTTDSAEDMASLYYVLMRIIRGDEEQGRQKQQQHSSQTVDEDPKQGILQYCRT